MEWFHCNACFQTSGQNFAVSSCGHIFCERCINLKQCSVCHTNCNYLPISEQMKPQEQVFFKDPMKLIQTRMEHIAQIDLFQRKQKERVIAFFRHKSTELERRLKEVNDQCYRQVSELKRENAELLKPLSQRRLRLPVSPGTFQTNGNTRRMSLPVAVTSPVTPRSRSLGHSQSGDILERFRDIHSGHSLATPPGSANSGSSFNSLQERGFRTPISVNTPTRSGHMTPNNFQFQFIPGSTLQSPRPWHGQYSAGSVINT